MIASRRAAPTPTAPAVGAWLVQGLLLERYSYAAGPVEPLPRHAHAEYQFGLSFDHPGEYHYRGARHDIPRGSLSVIQSGEPHAPSGRGFLDGAATFYMLYADPAVLQSLAAELTGKPVTLPFFPAVSIHDSGVLLRFRELFAVLEHNGTRLAQDSLVVLLLSHLLVRHADSYSAPRRLRSARPEVLRVRDYLHEHWSRNVSLQDLAGIVDLSPYHLSRVFRDELGVPPHVYQTHLRVERAKQMLVRGHAPAEVAAATGFYDQSHFGQRFKRYVGVTPGTYAQASKTFVDAKPTHS